MSENGERKNPGSGEGIMNCLVSLPVFSLVGGTEDLRSGFLRSLVVELEKRSLQMTVLVTEQCVTQYAVSLLALRNDLVIINGEIDFPVHRILIGAKVQAGTGELSWSGSGDEGMGEFVAQLVKKLDELVLRTPVWGCVLIGGKSSRMGRPKHLIKDKQGGTWLENTIALLQPLVDGIVVSGRGVLPESLTDTVRLADIPGVVGPLTGVLAAGRWQPTVTWLVVACDMPNISEEAVRWLLAERRAGCWGRVPMLAESDYCEPLFAWYDVRSFQLFEEQLLAGNLRIGEIARHRRIDNPVIPEVLRYAWSNVNTPGELQVIYR